MRTIVDDMVDALQGHAIDNEDVSLIVFFVLKGFLLADIDANLETVKARRPK